MKMLTCLVLCGAGVTLAAVPGFAKSCPAQGVALQPPSGGFAGVTPASGGPPHSMPVYALATVSADSRLMQDPFVGPEDILRLQEGDPWAKTLFPLQAWQALWGDQDGDTWADGPQGLDALDLPSRADGRGVTLLDLLFSMERDAFGWKDGDILGLDTDGKPYAVVMEDTLVQALSLTGGGIDLDALCRQEDGSYWFSLKDRATSAVHGVMEDGAILSYQPNTGVTQVIATEAEVQTWVSAARGSSQSLGDVKSLARHPHTGILLFTIQSPSADDATVFTNQGGGYALSGWSESAWKFQLPTEIDGLCFPADWQPQVPILATDLNHLPPSSPIQIRLRHATPFSLVRGRVASEQAVRRSARGGLGISTPGRGGIALRWPVAPEFPLTTDRDGNATYDGFTPPLPAGASFAWFSYQVIDLGEGGISTPLLLRIE